MNPEFTEEEMRRALFGDGGVSAPAVTTATKEPVPATVILPLGRSAAKKKIAKAFTPRLRIILRVVNVF